MAQASAHRLGVPLSGLVKAAVHVKDFVVPLGMDEQSSAFLPIDFALIFRRRAEPELLIEALEQALGLFPPCAGRFVEQELSTSQLRTSITRSQANVMQKHVCIVCNNAGVSVDSLDYNCKAPSCLGPLSDVYFPFANEAEPSFHLGGPLLHIKLSNFTNGQIIALTFARGLTDAKGMSMFLRTWSFLHRGEDPGRPPALDRREIDDLFRCVKSDKVKLEFALLNRHRSAVPRPSPEKSVVSFICSPEEVKTMIADVQDERRNRHVTLDRAGKELDPFDVACASLFQYFQDQVPVQTWVDYRTEFGVPLHFGNAQGQIMFDVPPSYEDAAETIRKRIFTSQCKEFWHWQRMQATRGDAFGVTLLNLLPQLTLEDIIFTVDDIPCVGLPRVLWLEEMNTPGYIAVLPHLDGGMHVEALVPREAAEQFARKRNCSVFPII